MDSKDLELYQEENRQILKGLDKTLKGLIDVLTEKITVNVDTKVPDEISISGAVDVNNPQESVTVENLTEVVEALKGFSAEIKQTIEKNSYKPSSEVTVKNIQKTIEVSNLKELKDYFSKLTQAVKDNQPIVNVAKQDIKLPNTAKDYISVRLTDGKSFYNAIANAVASGGGGLPVAMTRNSQTALATTDAEYATRVDDTSTTNVTYVGKAVVGSSPSSAVWQIKKVDETTGIVITWADGDTNFDNVWSNVTSLTYT